MSLAEDVALHRAKQVLLCRARFERNLRVEGIQFEKVAMRATRRRARSAITRALEIVDALPGAVGEGFSRGNLLGKFRHRRRESVKDPMDPRAHRRVRVVANQREALGVCRNIGPLQRRRNVFVIAGVFRRNKFAFDEGGTGQLYRHGSVLLL